MFGQKVDTGRYQTGPGCHAAVILPPAAGGWGGERG